MTEMMDITPKYDPRLTALLESIEFEGDNIAIIFSADDREPSNAKLKEEVAKAMKRMDLSDAPKPLDWIAGEIRGWALYRLRAMTADGAKG